MRTKAAAWQADVVTEVTLEPSKFRHRDFADEKYLERFKLNFHTENSQAYQGRVAKDQSNMRAVIPQVNIKSKAKNMTVVFKPLDKEEEMGPAHVKAFTTGVHKQVIDHHAEKLRERMMRNTYPELMQTYDPEPKLFVRNFRTLRPGDKFKILGEPRDGPFFLGEG